MSTSVRNREYSTEDMVYRAHCRQRLAVALAAVLFASLPVLAQRTMTRGLHETLGAADGRPVYILEPGRRDEQSPADREGMPLVHGQLTRHDAERVSASPDVLRLHRKGHTHVSGALRFELGDAIAPGQYDLWTLFTIGGVAEQTFTVSAGPSPEELQPRVRFKQRNVASWKAEWQQGGALTLYPQDRVVEIEAAGMQSDCKTLADFALVQREPLPEGVTTTNGAWRAAVEALSAPSPTWRILVLEGEEATPADPFYRCLVEVEEELRDDCAATILLGQKAEDLAAKLGIEHHTALLWMDAHWALRGVLTATATATDVAGFVAAVTASGPAPGPFPQRPQQNAAPFKPLAHTGPLEWLTVSGWCGPAGLSLWGLETEPRTRPNPGAPCAVSRFDSKLLTQWHAVPAAPETGLVVVEEKTGNYTWPRGVGYAHVYLDVEEDAEVILRLAHTGIGTQGWLDGQPLAFEDSPSPPPVFDNVPSPTPGGGEETTVGTSDQGGRIEVKLGRAVKPQMATMALKPGRHRLLLKFIHRHRKDETLAFAACLQDAAGRTPSGIRTRLSDPECDLSLQAEARRLTSKATVNAPGNLPHQGRPLILRYELQLAGETDLPVIPFDARLALSVTDYDGKEVMRRNVTRQFPGVVELDLGQAPERGYYAVHATLRTADGQLILMPPPDGFSVIGGSAAQFARRARKKLAITYYFMAPTMYKTAFPWMTRMGIYRNIGSSPGFSLELADAARTAGIALTMDFWDIHNAYSQEKRQELARKAAPYTRWFKSFNEVDIHAKVRRTPEHWVARTRGEYEAVKAALPDSVYVGGSLVRPGSDDWFTECLKLGLDRYIDVWDVHCYPQYPPVLEGSISNSPNETELGVKTCYKRLGRSNDKPFWIGETGARCSHGHDARRWQADTVAKMIACALSREDFHYIGFLWPWTFPHAGTHAGPRGNASDIPTAHMPAEAAYYTAGALIDGFDYTRLELGPDIQAARFGTTAMLWSTGQAREVGLPLENDGPWVAVDVVGRVRDLPVDDNGNATVTVDGSPRYILARPDYERLTAGE